MAQILEFPKKFTPLAEKKQETEVREKETLQVVERIILAIENNQLDEEKTKIDLDALKDIYALFSVRETETIDFLSKLQDDGVINSEEKILLLIGHVISKKNAPMALSAKSKSYFSALTEKIRAKT